MSNSIIFYITLLNWEFLLKWYNFFWNFCWNSYFLLCTTIPIDFNSQILLLLCQGVGVWNFEQFFSFIAIAYSKRWVWLLLVAVTRVARWPVFHRPGRYFTANLAVAGKRPVFFKFLPAAGILKMNICSNCKKNLCRKCSLEELIYNMEYCIFW